MPADAKLFLRAENELQNQRDLDAERLYRNLINLYPLSEWRDNSEMRLGTIKLMLEARGQKALIRYREESQNNRLKKISETTGVSISDIEKYFRQLPKWERVLLEAGVVEVRQEDLQKFLRQ